MKSVETVMDDVKKSDPVYEAQVQKKSEKDKKTADAVASSDKEERNEKTDSEGDQLAALNSLLTGGARFLSDLSEALAKPGQFNETRFAGFIARDETSGKPYLKIPMPDTPMLRNIASVVGKFLLGIT